MLADGTPCAGSSSSATTLGAANAARAGRLEVDHVTPLQREPGQNLYDINGLQVLCRACHIEKTARENRRPLTPAELAWRELVNEMLPETN